MRHPKRSKKIDFVFEETLQIIYSKQKKNRTKYALGGMSKLCLENITSELKTKIYTYFQTFKIIVHKKVESGKIRGNEYPLIVKTQNFNYHSCFLFIL